MTVKTRKAVFAALIGLAGAATEVSLQLQNNDIVWTRAVVAGAVLGVFARALGAFLAVEATDA